MRLSTLLLGAFVSTASIAQPNTYDATIIEYTGLRYPCGDTFTPVVKIQNVGSTTMVSCVVETWKNGLLDNSFDWQLAVAAAPGQVRQPALPVVTGITAGDVVEIRIISVNDEPDEGADGNVLQVPIDAAPTAAGSYVVLIQVETSDIPEQLTWSITNDLAQVVAQGGPYVTPEATEEAWVTLLPNTCYMVRFAETSASGFSNAVLRAWSNDEEQFTLGGPKADNVLHAGLITGVSMDMQQRIGTARVRLLPNPSTGLVRLEMGQEERVMQYELTDAMGRFIRLGMPQGPVPVLDLSGEPNGAYVLTVRFADGSWHRERLVIAR